MVDNPNCPEQALSMVELVQLPTQTEENIYCPGPFQVSVKISKYSPPPHNIIKFFNFAFTNRPQQLSCHPRCLPPTRLLPPPTMTSSPRTMFLPTCSRQKPLKTRLADPDFYHKFVCWVRVKSFSYLNFCFARESTNLKKPARRLRTLRFQIYIFLIENIYSSIS